MVNCGQRAARQAINSPLQWGSENQNRFAYQMPFISGRSRETEYLQAILINSRVPFSFSFTVRRLFISRCHLRKLYNRAIN